MDGMFKPLKIHPQTLFTITCSITASAAWLGFQFALRSRMIWKKIISNARTLFQHGLNLYRPFLLIVTDETDCYISTLKEPTFTKMPLKSIQQIMLATIKECLAFYKNNKFDQSQINKLRNTAISLNKRIKLVTEVEKPLGTRKTVDELYAEAEGEIDDSYEGMYRNGLERRKSLEGILKIHYRYAKDNSDLLHYYLFKNLSTKQLKALCNLNEEYIYINPWYRGNQLLVKATPVGVYENAHKKDVVNNRFYVLDSLGDFTGFSATLDDVKNTMSPGFLKFEKEFTKQYLESLKEKENGVWNIIFAFNG